MKKYKVGYTTGAFDLFHIGHLNILKHAKEYCDYLIVGVSTDELIEQYKHKTPVIPFEERMEIVGAIKYVDKVVPQTTLDKTVAYNSFKFDVLFHGDDWKGSQLFDDMKAKFKALGVDLVFLPHTSCISTSDIVAKIKSKHELK